MILGVAALAGKTSRDRQISYYTINGYSADDAGTYCASGGRSTSVYTSTSQGLIATAYTNSISIYSNTALTTLADAGVYSDTPGRRKGDTSYEWSGTAWVTSNTCP